jgi:hypothetical protein
VRQQRCMNEKCSICQSCSRVAVLLCAVLRMIRRFDDSGGRLRRAYCTLKRERTRGVCSIVGVNDAVVIVWCNLLRDARRAAGGIVAILHLAGGRSRDAMVSTRTHVCAMVHIIYSARVCVCVIVCRSQQRRIVEGGATCCAAHVVRLQRVSLIDQSGFFQGSRAHRVCTPAQAQVPSARVCFSMRRQKSARACCAYTATRQAPHSLGARDQLLFNCDLPPLCLPLSLSRCRCLPGHRLPQSARPRGASLQQIADAILS